MFLNTELCSRLFSFVCLCSDQLIIYPGVNRMETRYRESWRGSVDRRIMTLLAIVEYVQKILCCAIREDTQRFTDNQENEIASQLMKADKF